MFKVFLVQTHVFIVVFLVFGVSLLVWLCLRFHGFGKSFHICRGRNVRKLELQVMISLIINCKFVSGLIDCWRYKLLVQYSEGLWLYIFYKLSKKSGKKSQLKFLRMTGDIKMSKTQKYSVYNHIKYFIFVTFFREKQQLRNKRKA